MYSLSPLAIAAFVTPALSATHNLFAGSFSGSTLYGLEFDDTTSSLTLVKNITLNTTSGSKWIHMDSRKRNIYVGTTGAFQSYAITSDLDLEHSSNVSTSTGCDNANFITSSTMGPYAVFATSYSVGCASQVIAVDERGRLVSPTSNVTYDSSAGVHGSDLSPDNRFFYSADDMGNAVWTHSYDAANGTVKPLQHLKAANGSDPRHLTVHPNGEWVYVVYEASSEIAVYARNASTGLLTFTNETYSLLPGYTNATSSYWADEVRISTPSTNSTNTTSPKYLLAATRSRTVGIPGYVSAFSLDPTTGAIAQQLFLLPTTDSGGSANAVEPAGFSEQFFAITDSGSSFVEVWEIAADGSGAGAVAHLALGSGPANVKWYS